LVRGHAAWALGQIGFQSALEALQGRLQIEGDAEVRSEIEEAIRTVGESAENRSPG
jgi:HEAT repeat protein